MYSRQGLLMVIKDSAGPFKSASPSICLLNPTHHHGTITRRGEMRLVREMQDGDTVAVAVRVTGHTEGGGRRPLTVRRLSCV